jgi:hypothetical protein
VTDRVEHEHEVTFYMARSDCGHIVRERSAGGLVAIGPEWCPQCQRIVSVYAYGKTLGAG